MNLFYFRMSFILVYNYAKDRKVGRSLQINLVSLRLKILKKVDQWQTVSL